MGYWIARDRDGFLCVYGSCPTEVDGQWVESDDADDDGIYYASVTYDNSPQPLWPECDVSQYRDEMFDTLEELVGLRLRIGRRESDLWNEFVEKVTKWISYSFDDFEFHSTKGDFVAWFRDEMNRLYADDEELPC